MSSRLGAALATAGALLGVGAGIVQWSVGGEIPDWSGDKLHPVQLGLITIGLSLVALAAARTAGDGPSSTVRRSLVAFGLLAPAAICFTTVGRLWYLPGPLLIAGALVLLRSWAGRQRSA